MKITAFDPIIVTTKSDEAISVFEALGFERKHAPTNTVANTEVTSNRMKHENGYHVDIVQSEKAASGDLLLIRMNVDNFAEAYDILVAHGFKNVHGDETFDTKTSTSASMISPSGFMIGLVQHIRED